MKGFTIPLIGVLILIIVTASYAMMILYTGTIQGKIVVDSERALTLSHKTEFLRKMIDEYIPLIADKVTYDLGKDGGGYSSWDRTSPTETQLVTIYENTLKTHFPSNTISDDTSKTEIIFSDPEVSITDYSNGNKFSLSIDYGAKLIDKHISASSELNISSNNYTIYSKYFEAIRIGRKMFDGEDYLLSDSLYNIVKLKGPCSGLPSSVSSGVHLNDFLEFSIICGLEDVPGLAHLSDIEILEDSSVETRLSSISSKIKSYLQNKYANDLEFLFIPKFTRSDTKIKIDVEVTIDTLKEIPLTEEEINEGSPLLDNVVLNFLINLNYQL